MPISLVATENIKANPLNNFIELNPKKFAFKSSLESPIYDIYDVKKEQNIASFGSYPDVKLSNVQEEADYAIFFCKKNRVSYFIYSNKIISFAQCLLITFFLVYGW